MSPVEAGSTAELERLLREKLVERGLMNPTSFIGPRSPGVAIPLSRVQRRMWFAQTLYPDDATHNMVVGVRIDGPLDRMALQSALAGVFDRHSVLRTRYRLDPTGEPEQVIDAAGQCELPVVDLPAGPVEKPVEAFAALAVSMAGQAFDLASEPPLRAALYRAVDVHFLVLVLHHIAADEVTWDLIFTELSACYARESGHSDSGHSDSGQPNRRTDRSALDYADYAVWENDRLRRGDLDRQLDYWTELFSPLPPAVGFPTSSQAKASDSAGQQCTRALPVDTVRFVSELARTSQTSPFVVVLAALATLLHRYTGATDVVIGIPVLVRDLPETKQIGGNFTNTIAVRIDVDARSSFAEVLARTRTAFFAAYDHRDVPFDLVVERVAPRRSARRSPLFEVMFAATSTLTDGLTLAGTTITDLGLRTGGSMFDLAVDLVDGDTLAADFRTAKFTPDYVEEVLANLATVLARGGADPTRRVSELPTLDFRRVHPPAPNDGNDVAVQSISAPAGVAGTIGPEPRHAVERALAQLWCEVLDIPQVGAADNFFDVGGHSLLLARMQKLITEQLGYPVTLLDLYEHPTIAELAAHLRGNREHDQVTETGGAGSGVDDLRARAERGRGARAARRAQQRQRR